ncbi:MAG: STAS domain-containing protein [Thiobacillaceae bacterium]
MAIPFFRKGKDKPPADVAARNTGSPVPSIGNPPTKGLYTWASGASGIMVQESSGVPQTAIDEAAIFYASNQIDATEEALTSLLTSDDVRAWHMLFDLYRILGREKDFEQIALDYAVRFETSPPVWRSPKLKKTLAAPASTHAFPALLDVVSVEALNLALAGADKSSPVLLDFARIQLVDEKGADACIATLEAARKTKRKLQVSGVDRLIQLLLDLNRATQSRPVHWLFLLQLYQLLGRQNEFEDLAVDYAVRFEVSPPSWVTAPAVQVVEAPAAIPATMPAGDAFTLSGEITPTNNAALQELKAYATAHTDVVVDMAQVTRVDYASVSQFISLLMQFLTGGKNITLRGHNALVHELFRVMGIDQMVQLVPGKLT